MKSEEREFIVAEVSKTWIDGKSATPLLSEQFEDVVAVNWVRGYQLYSYVMNRVMATPLQMNETIVAVFKRKESGLPKQSKGAGTFTHSEKMALTSILIDHIRGSGTEEFVDCSQDPAVTTTATDLLEKLQQG